MFSKVRARFGGRLRVAASGAAPLSKDLAEFYEAVGMPLIEGYGLTEGGVVTAQSAGKAQARQHRQTSARSGNADSRRRRVADQERMPVFRLSNDPATTAEVLRDGWLHTGDVGHIDAEGYYLHHRPEKRTDCRVHGKKIFPSRVENLFKMEPLISQVLLTGDRLPYLIALFTINNTVAEGLKGMDEFKGVPAPKSQAPPVLAEIHKTVARVNKQLAPFEQVRKYRILARDFSIEQGELTATMKVRRMRAMENFKDHIDGLSTRAESRNPDFQLRTDITPGPSRCYHRSGRSSMAEELKRRDFLKAAALAAGPAVISVRGANNKINLGWIGVGTRGNAGIEWLHSAAPNDINFVAVSAIL